MLVLSRKIGQSIYVGDDITITVVQIRAGRVRIGIEAPKELAIARDNAKTRTEQDAPHATEGSTEATV